MTVMGEDAQSVTVTVYRFPALRGAGKYDWD